MAFHSLLRRFYEDLPVFEGGGGGRGGGGCGGGSDGPGESVGPGGDGSGSEEEEDVAELSGAARSPAGALEALSEALGGDGSLSLLAPFLGRDESPAAEAGVATAFPQGTVVGADDQPRTPLIRSLGSSRARDRAQSRVRSPDVAADPAAPAAAAAAAAASGVAPRGGNGGARASHSRGVQSGFYGVGRASRSRGSGAPGRQGGGGEEGLCGPEHFRNQRFKLIPRIVDGPWVARNAVPQKPSLLGKCLAQRYFRGECYIETDVHIG